MKRRYKSNIASFITTEMKNLNKYQNNNHLKTNLKPNENGVSISYFQHQIRH